MKSITIREIKDPQIELNLVPVNKKVLCYISKGSAVSEGIWLNPSQCKRLVKYLTSGM
jgi:hypothetical protein